MEGQDMHLPVGRDRDEGLDVHLSIAWGRHGRNAFDGDQFSVMGVTVMLDGRTRFDLVETKQLPETIGNSYCGVAHRVAWATTGLDGRNDLDAIQPILAANGSGGRAVEKLAGRAYFITGEYQGNAEGYRVHAGCLDFCERWKVKDKSQQTYAGTSKREIFDRGWRKPLRARARGVGNRV